MNVWIVIVLVFAHWIGDFVFQSDAIAKDKSKYNDILALHVMFYTMAIMAPMSLMLGFEKAAGLGLITFGAHFFTDYFTSRINSRLWAEGKIHKFFVSVGFDQALHLAQLILTVYFLL